MTVRQYLIRYRRVLLLIFIMVLVTGLATVSALSVLYLAAFQSRQDDLVEMVKVKANLINAVGRFDAQFSHDDHPQGPFAATLSQVADANLTQNGFGETGEFVIGELKGEMIHFSLPSRHLDNQIPDPVDIYQNDISPILMALVGKSGAMLAVDYRGKQVLAAYAPLEQDNFGLLAKIDLEEIRAPFYHAVLISFFISVSFIVVAVWLFHYLTSPLVFRLESLVAARTKELDAANQELLFMSQHDSLTGISNRAYFMERLQSLRQQDVDLALLFVDLDEFKPINDLYGHRVGDLVLTEVAQRLRSVVREEDYVARVGGDEFAVLLTDVDSIEDAITAVYKIVKTIKAEVGIVDIGSVEVGCSVGVVLDNQEGESDTHLISRADTAMYIAKRSPELKYSVG